MASRTTNATAPNLASVLLVKRKLGVKKNPDGNGNQPIGSLPNSTASYSQEKLTYHQDMSQGEPTNAPIDPNKPSTRNRQAKQLEVSKLDKKLEEINRKQEVNKNEAAGTWKGYDSMNYKISSRPESQKSTRVAPVPEKQVIYSFIFK